MLPEAFEPYAQPDFIGANIEDPVLPAPADLITSIYSFPYLYNPLRAMCNWYNQLEPGGLMIIGGKVGFSADINFYETATLSTGLGPVQRVLDSLGAVGVRHAISGLFYGSEKRGWTYQLAAARVIAVQRKANTMLCLGTSVVEVVTDEFSDYKQVYYEPSDEPIKVIEQIDG